MIRTACHLGRLTLWTIGFFLGLGVCASIGQAEQTFTLGSTPGKLPKDILPRHYALSLIPDETSLHTSGEVTIDIEVLRATNRITFNALDLEFDMAKVDDAVVATPRVDATQQTATLELTAPLSPGAHRLVLGFRGKIIRQAAGLYLEKYKTSKGEKVMLGTQMESTFARRMFPCWDEPVFRATFQLTVTVPATQTAISNTQIVSERRAADGSRVLAFAPTPPMASYLVVLCVGELEAIRGKVDGIQLAVWTTEGKKEQGRYALEATRKIVHYYNQYFGVKYPLPKLDLIAVPGGFSGAMENWGGITFNESILLFDPATSSQGTREAIFSVIAHEVAHQWFGDLVTMAWWDNLWLNEGFASWMGTKCTDHFNPKWQVWLRAHGEKETAMNRDARKTTHPIQQPVANEAAAEDAFDEITYLKGQSFLRMLEDYLGEKEFRAGIRSYTAQHAYGSTTTADLWLALEKSTGKPVGAMAHGWTTQPGLPVVKVESGESKEPGQFQLRQEPFTIDGTTSGPLLWQIPVSFSTVGGSSPVQHVLLTQSSTTTTMPRRTGRPLKANWGDRGYYRCAYAPSMYQDLVQHFDEMSEDDRVNLLSDQWALVEARQADVADYLNLVDRIPPGEPSLVIWEDVLGSLASIEHLEEGTPGESAFKRWERNRLQGPMARLGWDEKRGETFRDGILRTEVLELLGSLDDPSVVAEARRRFVLFLSKPDSLAPDLRDPVCTVVGIHADEATWEKLHAMALATPSTEEQNRYHAALQSVKSEPLARRVLELALTEERPVGQWIGIVPSVAARHPELAWEFAKTHADALLDKIPASSDFISRHVYFGSIARSFTDAARADELESFVAAKVGPEAGPETTKVAERIRFNAAFKARLLPTVDAWVAARKISE